MSKKLLFSVTLNDCDVQTFRAGGPGGQNQNKRDTGVRIVHRASGARGESREQRSQFQNKQTAFRRMAETGLFKIWLNRQLSTVTPEQRVARDLEPSSLLVEGRGPNGWQPI